MPPSRASDAVGEARPILSVDGLRVAFQTRTGTVRAVNGVSFEIGRGEILGLLGESGSGKSVTGLSILGLLPRGKTEVSGRIHFDGQNILDLSEKQLRRLRGRTLSMILQDPLTSLNPVFTIGWQIAEALRIHRIVPRSARRDHIVALLRRLRIPGANARLGAYPHQFSGGMRQRVVAAIALSGNPKLLIADEPTTALDVTVQAHFLDLLKELQSAQDFSVLFVTHDLGVIARVCDRAAVMYAGRIVEEAPVRELFGAPRHPYTQALLRTLPRVENRGGRLPWIKGQPPTPGEAVEGCAFAPRCDRATESCRTEFPAEQEIGPRHRVSCWHAGESAS